MASVQGDPEKIFSDILIQYGHDAVSEEELIAIADIKNEAKNYIKEINQIGQPLKNKNSLQQRFANLLTFMHRSDENARMMVKLSHGFEIKLNEFLGRVIPLTYVTDTGDIKIMTEVKTGQIYNKVVRGDKYTTKIFNAPNLIKDNPILTLSDELQQLQRQINKGVNNRRLVYSESLRRFDNKDMDYKQRDSSLQKTIYWHINQQHIHYSDSIPARGYIGQAYVSLIVNTPDPGYEITRNKFYTPALETQIYKLVKEVQKADSIAGILIGDVLVLSSNGNIQLAVKQGWIFSTASIAPNLAIAYAILDIDNNSIIKNLRSILQNEMPKLVKTSWNRIFYALTGKMANEFNLQKINLQYNLF